MAMGAADIVPGVSGGTIALIAGIYERLINALSRHRHNLWQISAGGRDKRIICGMAPG